MKQGRINPQYSSFIPMGSSRKPAKQDDRPIIPTPRTKGSGGEGGGQSSFDLNQTCPVYFDVKLSANPLLRAGAVLRIDNRGRVLLANNEVGALNAQQFRKVTECLEHGYAYPGQVLADKDKKLYGRFERTTT